MRPALPYDGTITRRRELRKEIRAWLGTSSDDPPGLQSTLSAAARLNELLHLTSGGRYAMTVTHYQGGDSRPITEIQALERGYREAQRELPDPLGGGDPYHDADRR